MPIFPRSLRSAALTLGIVIALAPGGGVSGQGSALSGVRGITTDSAGTPLAHVHVEIRHDPTGRVTSVLTDVEGRFVLANLAAGGPYSLAVTRLGYGPQRVEAIQLLTGSVRRIDFVMRPAALALPAVEVRVAADPRFGAERTGAATVLDRAAVEAQPTIARNVMALSALSPMAAATEEGFTIAGQNARYNAFTIDGGRYQDMFGLSVDGAPGGRANARPLPLQAVEQFQVLVAPFDVRQSGFTGGLLNVVTRSGTNEWQVSGFGNYRDQRFLGNLEAAGGIGARPERFENSVAGLTFGGPLRRDRAHIFVALELERRTNPSGGYSLGSAEALATRIAPDSAARFVDILRRQYGYEPGVVEQATLNNPRANIFVRTDWRLGDGHRLMLRHNQATAERDMEPNRGPTGTYELGSQVYEFGSVARGTTAQLISAIGGRWSNDLMLNVQHIRDRTTPTSSLPIVEVAITSEFDTLRFTRPMRAGGHFEAQANSLAQTGIEVRNAMTAGFGAHLVTIGAGAELQRFTSRYTANPYGFYSFGSLAELEANTALRFERTLVLPDAGDNTVEFGVSHFSAFAQNEWSVSDRLTLSVGLRADVPIVHDRPQENAALKAALDVSTATVPKSEILWAPRVAFNWQSRRTLRTQLRGGAGVFTGRPAYAWLANAYAQTGLSTRLLQCTGTRAPVLDASAPADACRGNPTAADVRHSPITVFSQDFRFPQDLRVALGADQVLPWGLVGTVDLVYARAHRQIFLSDINLGAPALGVTPGNGYTDGFGFERRVAYGTPTTQGFSPNRRSDAFGHVIQLGEQSENRALAASIELAGTITGIAFRGAYTFTRSIDVQSLAHRDAASSFGGNATYTDPNRPHATLSDFDRPHKALFTVTSTALERRTGTQLSLFYTGESGTPFTYVYSADINGDGFPGVGTSDIFNDPLFVPDVLPFFPGPLGSGLRFMQMLEREPCLKKARNSMLLRNECRGAATHRLDLRIAQAVRTRGTEIRVTGDLLNLLHLLGSERGHVQRVEARTPLLGIDTRPTPEAEMIAWYGGAITRNERTGRIEVLPPYTLDLAASRWQAQVGVEVRRLVSR